MACSLLVSSPSSYLLATDRQVADRQRRRKGFTVLCSSGATGRRVPGGGESRRLHVNMPFQDAEQEKRHREYLEKLRRKILRVNTPTKAMEMVDTLQRLGIAYHFEEEVGSLLSFLHETFNNGESRKGSLHDVSLSFRLLRQQGFHVPTDAFDRFLDGHGSFKQSLSRDIPGLLSLHEASYLGVGEHVLDEAQDFSHNHLKASIDWLEPNLGERVREALDHPYHTSPQWFNFRSYLEHFTETCGKGSIVGELARLDFKIVQSLHQSELSQFTRWWMDLGLSKELRFARNQPLKWYIWSMTILANPKFSDYRIEITKSIALIYIIDDIFDVHGSFDELVLFTEAIKKWDPLEIDNLPEYMKICYTTLYNVINETACKVYKEHGWDPICSLRKSWIMLFDAFLMEARWFSLRQIPKTDEYLQNGVISTGVHVVLIHSFFLLGHNLTMENIMFLEEVPTLISSPATILRLWDDLGSAKDENQSGFDGSYMECHMREHGNCSIESAKGHMMDMISCIWKKLNKATLSSSSFSSTFLMASLNFARMVKTMYSYEDNRRLPMLEKSLSLLFHECA